MSKQEQGLFNHWRQDLPASVVVFLVALPLCLGIALASGAPLFAGLISGIVGGIVVGSLSRSPLSVSGPAAGLAVVVLGAIQSLPSYQAFLLAVVLAGLFQILLGVARAGTVSNYIPSAVIKGMLAAIGIILVLKQIPHALGYDADYEGDQSFWQDDGYNTFSELIHLFNEALSPGAIIISVLSLIFLFWWDSGRVKKSPWLKEVPSSLIVVVFGVLAILYGYLYVVLQLEDLALLMGSLGLFAVLGLIMYLTRKINWYDFANSGISGGTKND